MRSAILLLVLLVAAVLLAPVANAGCNPVCVEKIVYDLTALTGTLV